jgi:hypothetical protein
MTQDEIIEMARQAGFITGTKDYADGNGGVKYAAPVATGSCLVELKAFAKLVAAKEREACAKVCDELHEDWKWRAAESIRARGEA